MHWCWEQQQVRWIISKQLVLFQQGRHYGLTQAHPWRNILCSFKDSADIKFCVLSRVWEYSCNDISELFIVALHRSDRVSAEERKSSAQDVFIVPSPRPDTAGLAWVWKSDMFDECATKLKLLFLSLPSSNMYENRFCTSWQLSPSEGNT